MKRILLLLLISSCSSTQSSVPIEVRTYDMCVGKDNKPTCDGYCYQDDICVKKFIGICLKREIQVVDKFDIVIPKDQCEKLFNLNFVLSVRKKPI